MTSASEPRSGAHLADAGRGRYTRAYFQGRDFPDFVPPDEFRRELAVRKLATAS